jgi:predicted component of type VI protein secretion system
MPGDGILIGGHRLSVELLDSAPATQTVWTVATLGGQAALRVTRDITVGRAASNDLVLDDPGVSPVHARLMPLGGYLWVRDESGGQTFIDGAQLLGAAMLHADDRLRFGPEEVFAVLEGEAAAAAFLKAAQEGTGYPELPEAAPPPRRVAPPAPTVRFDIEDELPPPSRPTARAEFEDEPAPPSRPRARAEPQDEPPPPRPTARAAEPLPPLPPELAEPVRPTSPGYRRKHRRRGIGPLSLIALLLVAGIGFAAYEGRLNGVAPWIAGELDTLLARVTPAERATMPVGEAATTREPARTDTAPAEPPIAVPETAAPQKTPAPAPTATSAPSTTPAPNETPEPTESRVETPVAATAPPRAAQAERPATQATTTRMASSEPAGMNLGETVGRLEQALARHRFADASSQLAALERRGISLERHPEGVDPATWNRLRVVQMLVRADALLQQRRIVSSTGESTLGYLTDALRLAPGDPIALDISRKAEGYLLQQARTAADAGNLDESRRLTDLATLVRDSTRS